LEEMKNIPDGSIDCIITDPPYWTIRWIASSENVIHWMKWTNIWDISINPSEIFESCERILRMNGCLILFSQEPYTSQLIAQAHWNLPFSYRMIWKKDHFANALIAKKAPVSYYEDILVFFKTYDTTNQHPLRQYVIDIINHIWKTKKQIFEEMGHQWICHFWRYDSTQFDLCTEKTYNELIEKYRIDKIEWFKTYLELLEINRQFNRQFNRRFNLWEWKKYKSNVLEYKKDYEWLHPTQKPLRLIEDLIQTYSSEWDTILDFTAGSFTTAIAAQNTNRKWICIEKDENYYNIWINRLNNLQSSLSYN
jgi:DNA modification methylase